MTRIVITGIGWITPLGLDINSVWSRLLNGDCAIASTRKFDASKFPTTFASEVPAEYDFRFLIDHPEYHEGVGLNTAFALGAAAQAWHQAGLTKPAVDPSRVGLYLGSGEGSLDFDNYAASNIDAWNADEREVDTVKWIELAKQIEQEPNMPLSHLAMEFGIEGPAYNCLTACAASTQAIGEASEAIRRGEADVMLTGGAHTMIHPLGVTGFNRLTALSNRNDDPLTASRPFSRDRDGFVLGEGAGMLVLETLDSAQARGATPLAEIIGYGSSADAYRITDIPPDGSGAVACINEALDNAGVSPADIDYFSAHGTGTSENDKTETRAIKTVFGDNANGVAVSSIKSMMGHLIAAAGAVELITCVLAIRDQKLPPTINLNTPDPECDLDYVPNTARDAEVNTCISFNAGFGGQNDAIVIRKFTG